ncbi:MAG: hypothetical protein AAFP77_20115 [Bacteroidota bacterium]
MKHFIILLLASVVWGTSCGNMDEYSHRIPAVEKSQFIRHAEDWRNLRYGEVIPVFRKGAKLYIEVYNTIGSNELPQELWEKLAAEEMKASYGAEQVILNGPRYWVLNRMSASGATQAGKVANFGGIEMTLRATIATDIFEGAVGTDKLYTENEIQRETTFHFWKDNMVYELTSPEGEIYRMQSYAQMVDPNLTIEQLATLGERLSLPEGWSYEARVLEENSTMVADGLAIVINDELGNSYQKIIP